MALILRYAAKSDVGMVRADNEDSGYAGSRMLVVADGMGGHAAGELASATAVASFAALDLDEGLQPDDSEILGVLAGAVDTAHQQLGEVAGASPESRGMGTTLTALAWLNNRVAVAHIGDSRAYLMRDGVLNQLTKDHTFVQTLVDSGRITPEEALTHERRNLLMKALDGVNVVESDLSIREVRAGDRFLLCTDGLCGVVAEATIAGLMASTADPTGVVDALVEQALAAGAPDNVTALVADVVAAPDSAGVHQSPIVVGAASERRNRDRLPGLSFPEDSQPDPAPRAMVTQPSPTTSRTQVPASQSQPPTSKTGNTRRMRAYTVVGLIAVVLLVAGGLSAWAWTRSQYFVGEYQGSVAVFQGVQWGLGDHGWSTVEEVTPTKVNALPEFQQEKVQANIGANSQADALRITSTLADAAEQCATKVPVPAGCPPRATPPKPKPTATPVPSPTPNPTLSAART